MIKPFSPESIVTTTLIPDESPSTNRLVPKILTTEKGSKQKESIVVEPAKP